MHKNNLLKIALIPALLSLTGCAATEMAIQNRNLSVQTKMSKTIFLTPVSPSKQTVYVQLRSTSDQSLNIAAVTQQLDAQLENQGYRVVPYAQAHYLLQVSVLSVGKTTQSAAQAALGGGYGGALAGVLGGALAGAVISQSYMGAGVGGLTGGAVSFLADSLVHTNTYDMVTDVQVGERHKRTVATQSNAELRQGTQTQVLQQSNSAGHWLYYRTRIVSVAQQTDLAFKKALPALQGQLVHSLAGIL